MQLLKGLPAAKKITAEVKEKTSKMSRPPKLMIVRIGADEDALSYENGAKKRMEKAGITCEVRAFDADVETEEFYEAYAALNRDPETDGILLFRPLPKRFSMEKIEALTDPEKDVDCMCTVNMGRLFLGQEGFKPCTAQAVIEILKYYEIPLTGKRAVVIGRSAVVGKPLAMLLLSENATVTVCHTRTKDLVERAKEAEILITAAGQAEMVDGSFVSEGTVVIDVGINVRPDGTLTGDCAFDSVSEKAAALTPVPGGVGSVTTSVLARQVLEAALKKGE